jgi:hypothetical protein
MGQKGFILEGTISKPPQYQHCCKLHEFLNGLSKPKPGPRRSLAPGLAVGRLRTVNIALTTKLILQTGPFRNSL